MELALGPHRFDISSRALVMGILNRTPDSFYDQGRFWDMDDFFRLAERLVLDGADLLDVGGVKAGPGAEVGEAEELERVVPAVQGLRARFDIPLSIDTWRSSVAEAAFAAGAVVGNDISGFADPDYLPVAAARAGRAGGGDPHPTRPRVPDPEPHYDDVVAEVSANLVDRARQAEAAGIPRERVVIDAGLDLGKTWQQSLELLRRSEVLVALGWTVLLSASNKTFLGRFLDLEVGDRREASIAAHALGILGGCRILRAHDVPAARRVADVIAAVLT